MAQIIFLDLLLVKHDPLCHFPYITEDDGFYIFRHDMVREAYRFSETHMVAAVERIKALIAVYAGILLHFTAAVGANKEAGQGMSKSRL